MTEKVQTVEVDGVALILTAKDQRVFVDVSADQHVQSGFLGHWSPTNGLDFRQRHSPIVFSSHVSLEMLGALCACLWVGTFKP